MSFEALKRDGWPNFYNNSNPRCPHCGYDCDIIDDELPELYDEGDHCIDCPSCHEEFVVQTMVSYSFRTDEQESEDDFEKDEEL